MKKRNVLLAVVLAFSMLFTACGAPDPFEGKWVGTFDMTELVMEMVSAEEDFESYEEYLHLEGLILEVHFTFEDGNMKIAVQEDTVNELVSNLETSMYNMMDSMMKDMLITMYQEMFPEVETLDDVAVLSGMYENGQALLDDMAVAQGYADYDTMITGTIASINMGDMMEDACTDLNLFGEYKYDEETGILTIYYEDSTYEEMQYKFMDDELVIRVSADDFEMDFHCEKVTE